LVYAHQLKAAIEFVDRHPTQRMILDHIAKPSISFNQFDQDSSTGFREVARRENVWCKFSGVATEVRDPEWTLHTVRPYWEAALDAFGTDRLMYGSDWPVCLLRTDYLRWVDVVTELASELSPSQQSAFWYENAAKAYRLETKLV
jgi:L-fuconolactonase